MKQDREGIDAIYASLLVGEPTQHLHKKYSIYIINFVKMKTKFKQTEIGEIPEGWQRIPLSEYATIVMGQSPSSKYYNEIGEGIEFLQGIRSFGDRYPSFDTYCTNPTKVAEKNDILLSVRAPVGEVNIAPIKLCIGRGLAALSSSNNSFLYYLLKFYSKSFESNSTGTVFSSVSKTDIERVIVDIPNITEQQQIASILSSLDDKIELNRKMNKTLEDMAKALFKYWFVDFEFPNEEGKPYKSSGGEMVESELGPISKGWSTKKLMNIADISIGRTPPRMQTQWFSENPKDIGWLSIRDMGSCGVYVGKTSEHLTKEAIDRFSIPIIPKNTVVLSFKLTVGRVAISTDDMLSNEAIAHIKLNNKSYSTEYIYLMLKNFDFSSLGTTSSIATAVNSQSIKGIPIIEPDFRVLSLFSERIQPIFSGILVNQKQIDALIKMRDSLLPKLMSGKIRTL